MSLTRQQYSVLCFLDAEIKIKGYAPSYREIASYIGVASASGIHRILHLLATKGYVRIFPTRHRSLHVIKVPKIESQGKDPLAVLWRSDPLAALTVAAEKNLTARQLLDLTARN